MARQFFKDLPDTSTPLTASRLNGLLDGEEPMGNLVVDSIRTKNMFNSSTIVQGDIADGYPDIRMTSRQVLWLEPGTYTFSTNLGSSYQFGIQVQNVGTLPLSTWPSTFIYSTNWLATGTTTHTFTTTTAGWFDIMLRRSDNGSFTSTDITNLKGYNYQLETGEDATTYSPYQQLGYPDILRGIPSYNSTYISQIGYANFIKFGKLVIVNMNGQVSQNLPTNTVLFSNLPPLRVVERAVASIAFANNSSARVYIEGTEIKIDGATNMTGWFQGQIVYTTD